MLISIGLTQRLTPLIFHYLAMNANSDDSMRELIVNWDTVSDFETTSQFKELRGHLTKIIWNKIDPFGINVISTHIMVEMLQMVESQYWRVCPKQ
jgi:hypothetical protein